MAGLDEESGLLKPTVQRTRGLTALVVAAAALSFFAGAAAATHATTTTELWPKIPKAPKIDNWIPDWMVEDANKGKKDADEAYEDAVDVIEVGWEETVDLAEDVPGIAEDGVRAVESGTKDAIEAIVDVDWAAAPEAVVEGSEEAIRGINGALPSLADLQSFLSTSASSTRRRRRPSSPPTKKPRRRRARATPTASACRRVARPILMDATRATSARCWAAR